MTEEMFGYLDLDYEAELLLDRMVARFEEKESEHEPAEWRGDTPNYHFNQALSNVVDAAHSSDREEARRQAADVVNHLLMALANADESNGYANADTGYGVTEDAEQRGGR